MDIIFERRNFVSVSEFLPNQLYLVVCRNIPCSTDVICSEDMTFFSIDDELVYENYYGDFGPLNILALFQFSEKLLDKLGHFAGPCWYSAYENSIFFKPCKANKLMEKFTRHKVIVLYTMTSNEKRANAAFLMGCFAILYMGYSPCLVNRILSPTVLPYRNFQDAVLGLSPYTICLKDCLDAVFNAAVFGFFDFNDFNYEEFIYWDNKKHGQVNWVIPNKLLALPGPVACCIERDPMAYVAYFNIRTVTDIIALNEIEYDCACFENNGIRHHRVYVAQGDVPDQCDLQEIFQTIECAQGAVAIHCKAGLGRTGAVICAYLIKHYKMTAREAIAWTRICRPGSVLGCQQKWLECKERDFLNQGDCYREENYGDCNKILCHSQGIYNYCIPTRT